MEIIAKFYPHIWSQKLIDQIVITSEVVIKEEIKGVGEAEFVMPIAPGIKEECKVELYESNGNEDNLLFRGYIHEINPVWGQFQSLKIIAREEKAIFHKRKTLRKHTFTAQALSTIIKKLIEPYNTEFNEDWGFEIQREETITLEIAQGDDYYDIFDEVCEQKELFWTVVDGTVHFKKHWEDLRETQILEYDGLSPNPWNITNIELIGTASGGNVVLVEDSKWNLTVDKSQYSGVLTGVISKQIRKGDDSEKAKQFAKEQARPQRKYQIQVANSSIIANLWDRIKVEVVNTNSFYDYSGEAIVQSKTTSYSNASKVVVYGIQEFLVSPFTAENRVENVEKSIKLLRQRKGGGETPAPQVDLSWYATSSAVNQAIQSQNTKIEQKADSSFVQWVAQTAQTALNTANQAKQTAESKAPIQHTHNKSEVWLDNVDNTSDEDKPISKATKKALELKCSFADIVDNLNTEEIKPLSAKQGKVLKGLIDNINRILVSDDTDLDQLQEIVNYIKQNKKILSQLGISNIVGLVEALNGKANKVHTHTKSQISDFPTSMPASDVHKRAKQANKPTYTISEIQGLQEALDNKSSSVASLDRIDFNYTTNLTQKKFRIGSRYQFSNIPHDQGGHQLQVLWWDLQPQGTGDDGGWGLMFWPDQNPYLQMQGEDVAIGRTGGMINPKTRINFPQSVGLKRDANTDGANIYFRSSSNDDSSLDFKLYDDGSEWFRFLYNNTRRVAFNHDLATYKQKFFAHAQFGEFPTISLAIWDSDTGFNWNGDGNFTMKANGADLNHFYNGRAPIVRQGMNNGEIKNLTKDAYANENKRSEVIYMVDKEWVFIGDKQIASCWGGGLDLIAVDKTIVWDASGTRTAPSDWLLFFQWEWRETRYWSAKAYINEVDIINLLLFSHDNLIAKDLHYGLGIIKVRKWDITLRTTSWNYGQKNGKIILKYFIPS